MSQMQSDLELMAMAAQAKTRTRARAASPPQIAPGMSPGQSMQFGSEYAAGGQPLPAPTTPTRSILGEGIAAAEAGIGQLAQMTGLAGPVRDPFTPTFAPEDASGVRNAAQWTARTIGGAAPALAAGMAGGGAVPVAARIMGSGAPAAISGVGAAQGFADSRDRGLGIASSAAIGAVQGTLGMVPLAGALGRITTAPGVRGAVADAAIGAGSNVAAAVGSELIARSGGAEPIPLPQTIIESALAGGLFPVGGRAVQAGAGVIGWPTRAPLESPAPRTSDGPIPQVLPARAPDQPPGPPGAPGPRQPAEVRPPVQPRPDGQPGAGDQGGAGPAPQADPARLSYADLRAEAERLGVLEGPAQGRRALIDRVRAARESATTDAPSVQPGETLPPEVLTPVRSGAIVDAPVAKVTEEGLAGADHANSVPSPDATPNVASDASDPLSRARAIADANQRAYERLVKAEKRLEIAKKLGDSDRIREAEAEVSDARDEFESTGGTVRAGKVRAVADGTRQMSADVAATVADIESSMRGRAKYGKKKDKAPATQPSTAARTPLETPDAVRQEEGQGRPQGLLSPRAPDTGMSEAGAVADAAPAVDRVTALGDRIEQRARQRMAQRAQQVQQIRRQTGGRATGATTLPGDIIDFGAIIAARAIKAGATTAKAIRDLVVDDLKLDADTLKAARRVASRIVRGSVGEDGKVDDARFERIVGQVYELDETGRVSRAGVDRAAGVNKAEAPTISERRALRGQMRAEQRGAAQGYRAGVADEKVRGLGRAERARLQGQREGRAEQKVTEADRQRLLDEKRLRRQLRRDKRVAGAAYREGYRVAASEGRQRIETLRADIKAKRGTVEGFRDQAMRLADSLPLRVRGKMMRAVQNATNYGGMARATRRMAREFDAYEGRDKLDRLAKTSRRKVLAKLDDETRGKVAAAALGLPSPPAGMKIADMREAILAKAKDIRQKLGSKNADEVAAAREQAANMQRQVVEIVHEFRRRNRVILEGKLAEAADLRTQVLRSINDAPAPRFIRRAAGGVQEGVRTPRWRKFVRLQLTNESIAHLIDNGDQSGVANRVVRGLWTGESRMYARIRNFQTELDKLAKQHGFGSLGGAMEKIAGSLGATSQKTVRVEGLPRMSLGQAMDIIAMDPATRARIDAGNAVTFRTRPNAEFQITPEQFAALEQALTPEQRAFVRDVKGAMETQIRDPLFAALRRIKGWEPERIADYYPTRRNMKLSLDPDKYNGWVGAMSTSHLEDAGFTINRTGGKTPFIVGDFLDTVLHHVQRSAAIIELAEQIRTAEMVLLHPEVRPAMEAKYGTAVIERMEQMVRSASELGAYTPQADFDRIGLRIIQNVSRALTSINTKSWARQLGGVPTLAADMPATAFRAGLAVLSNPAEFARAGTEMTEHSGFFWNRYAESPAAMLSGLGSSMGPTVSGARASSTAKAAGRSLLAGRPGEAWRAGVKVFDAIRIASWFDSLPARVAWVGWKAEARRLHPEWSEPRVIRWAAEQAEASFRRTQSTFSVLDSSELLQQARHAPLLASLVAFTGDSNKAFNMLYQARGDRKKLLTVSGLRALNAAWGSVVSAGAGYGIYTLASAITGNEYGKERQRDQAMKTLGEQFIRDMAGTVLFGDDLVSLATGIGKFQNASALETPASGKLNEAARGLGDMALALQERLQAADDIEAEKAAERFARGIEDLAVGGTTMLGLPLAPIYGDVKRFRRAAGATAVDDLLYERQKLGKIATRTPEQQGRLEDLNWWYRRTYLRFRKEENAMRKVGDTTGAEKSRAMLEKEAAAFMKPGEVAAQTIR